MTRPPRRITLRIDRITAAQPGLDRTALEQALHREISRLVVDRGTDALGAEGHRPQVRAELPAGKSAMAPRIARAVIGALKS